MAFWSRRTPEVPARAGEPQAVIVCVSTADAGPTSAERTSLESLRDQIHSALISADVGAAGATEWSQSGGMITAIGPSAEAMWEAIMPVLELMPLPRGSHAIKRFGGAGCTNQERVNIEWAG